MTRLLLAFVALALVVPSGADAAERCRGPVVADGQPALVAVVMDGISSAEPVTGTSSPLDVPNWCPALPSGAERRLPAGLDYGFRTWAGLATDDGAKPLTQTCRPGGGLGSPTCLVGRLADAGAIILPYSYAGAAVAPDGRFTFHGYTSQTTFQAPATSIARLDELLASIAKAWPAARVLVISHSYGGTVSSGWWEQHVAGGLGPVRHVFTLDSPVNGVKYCAATALVFSASVADELCRRWNDRDAYDAKLLGLDRPRTLTTIGTPDDPAYQEPVRPDGTIQASGGGELRDQVLYAGGAPKVPPSVVNDTPACSGAAPASRAARATSRSSPARARRARSCAPPG